MTCPTCAAWYATTEQQLANRLKNMADVPGSETYPCPQCGNIEWSTSRDMIVDEAAKPRRWMKWWPPTPPSWPVIRVINGILMLVFIGLGLVVENRWLAFVEMFMAGVQGGLVLQASSMITVRRSFDAMAESFNQMRDINEALVQNRIEMHFQEMHDDDGPPIAPRLH